MSRLTQYIDWEPEPVEVLQAVEAHRNFWKPDSVKVLLLAESHVYTTLDDINVKVCIDALDKINCPKDFIKLVYCLGYGENTVLNGSVGQNAGTKLFWKMFSHLVNEDADRTFEKEKRINQKIQVLQKLKEKNIWLLDISPLALYEGINDDRQNKMKKFKNDPKRYQQFIRACWETYARDIIQTCQPEQVIVIGKMVWNVIGDELSKDFNANWVYQPGAFRQKDYSEHDPFNIVISKNQNFTTPVLKQNSVAPFTFTLHATQGQARAGTLTTPHGGVETPVFMPVGTHSAVRSLTHDQVVGAGAQILLCNAYHLYLRPGAALVEKAGGLHSWMNWKKPILTDSGGFQVFSLAKHRKITPEGVHFRDPLTGNKHFIGPAESMAMQNALGADIIMAFDECPPYPISHAEAKKSMDMTHRWLARCFETHARPQEQALFPIVQGSVYEDLRTQAVHEVSGYPAVGYAIGGVSVGEPREEQVKITRETAPQLPTEKPRYLMGVGTPEDLLDGIRAGVDMFDCVMPTRIGRHGTFFTPTGRGIIKNAEFTEDFRPLVEGCGCYACGHHSRAYLRHIFRQDEAAAKTLLSIHNIYTLIHLAQTARAAILAGTFEDLYAERMEKLGYATTQTVSER